MNLRLRRFVELIRKVIHAEDVLGAMGSFFVGVIGDAVAVALLVIAAIAFLLAGIAGERGHNEPRSGKLMLAALGGCVIVADAGLKHLGAARYWNLVLAVSVMALGLFAVLQGVFTGGRAWITLPKRVRRLAAWPYVFVLGELVGKITEAALVPGPGDETAAATIGLLAFILIGVLPLIFAFFVATPRILVNPDETRSLRDWSLRYLFVVAAATTSIGATTIVR